MKFIKFNVIVIIILTFITTAKAQGLSVAKKSVSKEISNVQTNPTKKYANEVNYSQVNTKSSAINYEKPRKEKNVSKKGYDIRDFSNLSITYSAPIDYFDMGMYGFFYQGYSKCGLGIGFGLNSNYGILDSELAGVYGRIGLTYGIALCKNIYISVPLTCTIGYYEDEFIWGMNITPQLGFKFGKLHIVGGYDYVSNEFFNDGVGNITIGLGISL